MNHGNPLRDTFEALWRKAKLPVTWYPKHRNAHLLITVGERTAVDSKKTLWYEGESRNHRRRKPEYVHSITVTAESTPELIAGHLVLERKEKPYARGLGPPSVKRYSVKYIKRVLGGGKGGQTVRLAQGILKLGGEKVSLVESRSYD